MIRRPASAICGFWMLGIIATYILGTKGFLVIFAALGAVGIAAFKKQEFCKGKGRKILTICLVFAVAGSIRFQTEYKNVGKFPEDLKNQGILTGEVLRLEQRDEERYRILLKSGGRNILIILRGELNMPQNLVGKQISLKADLELPEPRRNPNTFDYRLYLASKGIYVVGKSMVADMEPANLKTSFIENIHLNSLNFLSRVKWVFKENIYGYFDDRTAGFVIGMCFGDKSGIAEEDYESFQKNGICHILAVSGLHVAAIYILMVGILGNRKTWWVYGICLFAVIGYSALADFAPSVVRAAMMIGLHMISKMTGSRYDMCSSIFLTMFIMSLFNPLLILNGGFQLSFLAILSLGIVLPSALRIKKHWIVPALVIQAGMAPISAGMFNYFSVIAIIVNIPVVFIGGILVPLIFILFLISSLSYFGCPGFVAVMASALFQIISICVEFFCKVLIWINDLCFVDKISYFYVKSPGEFYIFLYYGLLFFLSTEFFRLLWQRKQKKNMVIFCAMIGVLALSLGIGSRDGFENCEVIFVDVGQGDCLLVRDSVGKAMLFDTGGNINFDVGKKILLPMLLKNGVNKLDMVLISHFDHDHVGGLKHIAKSIPIDKLAVYEGNRIIPEEVYEKTGIESSKHLFLVAGDRLEISKDCSIDIMFPAGEKDNKSYRATRKNLKSENDISLVAKITIKDYTILMTGDLDFETEKALLRINKEEDLQAQILKVCHHGSRYGSSEELLNAVRPKVAVIQVGKNLYGHPAEETLNRLEAAGAMIYRNDENGAVGIELKGKGKIKLHTMLN